jgi:hypothetical protein
MGNRATSKKPGKPSQYSTPGRGESPGSLNPQFSIPNPKSLLADSLAAIRTIPEARRDRPAALGAVLGRRELDGTHVGMPGFIENPAAAAAFQEGLSPLDGNQGNEEKTEVMVQALKPG